MAHSDPVKARAYDRAYKAQHWPERRARLDALKSKPCMDCGGVFPPECMDFDHRPGTVKKGKGVGAMLSGSEATLLAEIAKCDLVCANCHRIRTWRTRR